MTKCIRVDYTVKPDVDLDNLKAAITEFVAGIRSHHPEHRYTSFQHPADQSIHPHRRGRGGGASGLAEVALFPAFHGIFAGAVLRWARGDPS